MSIQWETQDITAFKSTCCVAKMNFSNALKNSFKKEKRSLKSTFRSWSLYSCFSKAPTRTYFLRDFKTIQKNSINANPLSLKVLIIRIWTKIFRLSWTLVRLHNSKSIFWSFNWDDSNTTFWTIKLMWFARFAIPVETNFWHSKEINGVINGIFLTALS